MIPREKTRRSKGDGEQGRGGESHSVSLAPRLPCLIGILLLLTLTGVGCAQTVTLKGTDLGKEPAPNFQLTDQNGKQVALTDLRGKVVVLTFLYTHCPDICPLIAEHLRDASAQLGSDMNRVAFVAVSIDPQHDTPDAIKAFNQQHQLDGKLIYLNGTPEQLVSVWNAYYVGVQADTSNPENISHSTRVVVIDKSGLQRVNMDSDFAPADLVSNVRALVNE